MNADPVKTRLLATLLEPTVEMMKRAGIKRVTIERDKGLVLQLESGEVVSIERPYDAPAGE